MAIENVKGRYFYLMLKENFYDSDDMVLLESMENGYKYSNILLKLYLRSLKDKGKLMYKNRIPYSIEMLAKLTRHDSDTVRRAIEVFRDMGIIEILDNGAIFMLDIENYIGKSSTEADRKRAYDRRIAEEKRQLLLENETMEISPEISPEKSNEHINIELESNINTNINIKTNKKESKNTRKQEVEKIYFENEELNNLFVEFLELRKKLKAVNSERAINSLLKTLSQYDDDTKYKMIENSVINSWKGVFPLKQEKTYIQQPIRKEIVPDWFNKETQGTELTETEENEAKDLLASIDSEMQKEEDFLKRKEALQEKLKNKYGKNASNREQNE